MVDVWAIDVCFVVGGGERSLGMDWSWVGWELVGSHEYQL